MKRIFDIDNWREIFATLSRNRTRTFLTAFGIFWGTAMLAMLLGGASGLEGMLRRNFSGFSTNMGAFGPSRTTISYRGYNKGLSWQLNESDINAIRRTTPLEYSSCVVFHGATSRYSTRSYSGQLMGVEGDYFKLQLPILIEGRTINASDVAKVRKTAVIGKNVAAELFGTGKASGNYIEVNGIYFLVVGVISQRSEASIGGRMDNCVYIPTTTLQKAFNTGSRVDFFAFTPAGRMTPTQLKPYIWRVLRANHPISPQDDNAMWFMDISEQFRMVDSLFMGITLLALFVGIGTLLAGIIGVGNIMWIIVKERTQEIGIRRAIGATPRDIIAQILSESMLLTSIAGTAGICFATLVLSVAEYITSDPTLGSAHFQLSFANAVAILVTFLTLGTAAGVIPAIKAMRIKPIEALNDK